MITLANYNDIVERMRMIVERYEKMDCKYNNYTLNLANGDCIAVRFLEKNLAHLLGVNIDYLRNSGKFKPNMSSYEMLQYFLEESYSFSKLCGVGGPMDFEKIFSKNVQEKIEAFETNSHISTADLLFILKYDNEKTYQSTEIMDVSDYYIVRKGKDNCYYVLGIIKEENTKNIYVPTTSRKYEDNEELNEFLKRIAYKQELTYAYSNHVSNIMTGYNNVATTNLQDKSKVLKNIIDYAKKYQATPSVANDSLFIISKNMSNLANQANTHNLLGVLSDSLRNRNVLDINTISEVVGEFSIPEDIQQLINICNDLVCSTDTNGSALENYSEISTENQSLKSELEELKRQLQESNSQVEMLLQENGSLQEQNEVYFTQFTVMEEACQKIKMQTERK